MWTLTVDIVDVGFGNVQSLVNILALLQVPSRTVEQPDQLESGIMILPGVGSVGPYMKKLKENSFDQAIKEHHRRGCRIIGICLGFQLLTQLGPRKYRLIMESLEMVYHYQAKTAITAEFEAADEWIAAVIKKPLETSESVLVKCEIMLYDTDRNHVATGYTNWHIKPWAKVKTKL